MTLEYLLTVWSIRLSLLLFVLAIIARYGLVGWKAGEGVLRNVPRVLWTAGCLFAVAHVLAVFAYVMGWSHQAAVEHTARQTRQLTGVGFGGGVYFNYVFLLVWIGDAAWWYGWRDQYLRRARLWDLCVIGYLWFIAFNATVIFETGAIRWWGLFATLALAAVGISAAAARKR